jgi:hypothetical protein
MNRDFPPKSQLKTKAINQMRADYFYSTSPQASKPQRYAAISLHTSWVLLMSGRSNK